MPDRALLKYLFNDVAGRYTRDIAPVLAPLAADFSTYIAPQATDIALDLGTGTGFLAWQLAPRVGWVAGLDLSHDMLVSSTKTPGPDRPAFVQGDVHDPPFARHRFTLIAASFGLNATDPDRSLRAVRRLLAPGGRFALQEWGPASPVDLAVGEALRAHRLDDPGPHVMALRDVFDEVPDRWSAHLQDADDYAEWLAELGFVVEETMECQSVAVRLASAEVFLTAKLAWTYRRAEVLVMDAATRAAFYGDVRARLADLAEPDGTLIWQPALFRVMARWP